MTSTDETQAQPITSPCWARYESDAASGIRCDVRGHHVRHSYLGVRFDPTNEPPESCQHRDLLTVMADTGGRKCYDCDAMVVEPATMRDLLAKAEDGEWIVERGHLLDDGAFCACHGFGHIYRPGASRNVWRGPVTPDEPTAVQAARTSDAATDREGP